MALDLDNEILKDFVDQVIDRIEILEGRVQSIRFVNGLVHEFTYSTPADLPVCQKCGGRIGSTCGCRTRTFDFAGKPYRRIEVGIQVTSSTASPVLCVLNVPPRPAAGTIGNVELNGVRSAANS